MARPVARLTGSRMGRVGRAIVAAALFISPSAAAVARTVDHSNVHSSLHNTASDAVGGKSLKGESPWHVLQPTIFGTSTEWTGSWWLDAASASATRAWPGLGATAFLAVAQKQAPAASASSPLHSSVSMEQRANASFIIATAEALAEALQQPWREAEREQQPHSGSTQTKQEPLVVTAPPDAEEDSTRALRGMRTLVGIMMVAVSMVFAMVVAYVAHQYRIHKFEPKVAKYNNIEDFKDYQTGLFDCWDDMHLCCFVFNCPWIIWAENISSVSIAEQQPRKVPILNFWAALSTILMLYILGNLGGGLVWLIMAGVLAYFRQKFRKAFAMSSNTGACLQDCLLYLCCGVCILAQDARHLEEARIQDHPAVVNTKL